VMPIPRIKAPVTFASMHIVHDSIWLLASSSKPRCVILQLQLIWLEGLSFLLFAGPD
jgi:hypothetical protein